MKYLKKFNEGELPDNWMHPVAIEIMDAFRDIIDDGFIVKSNQKVSDYNFSEADGLPRDNGYGHTHLVPPIFKYLEIKENLKFAIPYLLEKYNLNNYKLIRTVWDRGFNEEPSRIDLGRIDKVNENLSLLKLEIELK